ncbi:UNVERIFIED_CONTAM: hypothetical protein PYX00_005345 [Menopon gallinae]|uniref:Uncharacterized protein n=1 Tax=Menopon gallinae TaxID=328185 RepID=A0AAW2HR33_9NEOP
MGQSAFEARMRSPLRDWSRSRSKQTSASADPLSGMRRKGKLLRLSSDTHDRKFSDPANIIRIIRTPES